MPSDRPVRSVSSSTAAGCLPCPRCHEPWPSAGTTVPPRNFTKRPATFESVPVAAAKADAPDSPVNIALTAGNDEPSAAQSPPNSPVQQLLVHIFHLLSDPF